MAFNIVSVADRNALATDPEADFQSWKGIAGDGNKLRFSRIRSGAKRCWCNIADRDKFVRFTQGASFLGNFPGSGETVIVTDQMPGTVLKLTFDPPIKGIGVDIEPVPTAVVPGQSYRVELEVRETASGSAHVETANGAAGACKFVAVRSDADNIDAVELRVASLDNAGNAISVDFAINRLELLSLVGNIV
jgi:hypothetical protein